MAGNVAQLNEAIRKETLADQVYQLWNAYYNQRRPWVEEQKELRNYLFATDTTKTSNRSLPWRNSTTTPKLTQIRDNLHANYMAALFPNDDWLKWEGYTLDDATKAKREAIEFYMRNKTRFSDFYTTVSQLVYDYIDYGNAFADVEWVNEKKKDPMTGEEIPGYVGPRLVRISPMDILINPVATSFKQSPKLTRTLLNIGELKKEVMNNPNKRWMQEAFNKAMKFRQDIANGHYSSEDFDKAEGYSIDGFGNLYEYYTSPYVELIELEGDIYDYRTDTYLENHVITIMDRNTVLRKEPLETWLPLGTKSHVGWRLRPDNLYAMGPLHNLVGMQYRIDHLENIKADVFDIIAFPPLKIKGDVEEFNWCPGEEIHMDENGDVEMLVPDTTALAADMQISVLEQRMEDYAGAPKQAMGIRTPGEKTKYEVQVLESAAGRIFQEKVENFEINLLEPSLNAMLEVTRRNMDAADTIRVFDDTVSEVLFQQVTKEDITANGKLRPVGARHYFSQQQLLQSLSTLANTPIGQMIAPHMSSVKMAKLVEDLLGLERYELFGENIGIIEQFNQQRMVNTLTDQQVSEDASMMAADSEELDTD